MKKMLVYLLAVAMVASLVTGCTPKTPNDDKTLNPKKPNAGREPIPLNILTLSQFETEANVVRDQLKKAGFDVTLNMTPDYGSFSTQVDARNYDLMIASMRTLSGNPDCACRSMFHSKGIDNEAKILDPEVDRLIDLGSSTIGQESLDAYTALEKRVVEEYAYFMPVHRIMEVYSFNKEIINPDTVVIPQSAFLTWGEVDYNDPARRNTQPLIVSFVRAPSQLDPPSAIGAGKALTNCCGNLIKLSPEDQFTHEGALSYDHAIADGNADFYFVLRDNINFAKVENKKLVDSGILVGAEDVIFTIERLMDRNSVPNHHSYDNYQIVKAVSRVEDMSELENTKLSGQDKTVKAYFEEVIGKSITKLAANKDEVDNENGSFEVVKLSTKSPFPQILNFLCMYDVGVVCKEIVSKINNFDVSKFNPDKDTRYGDVSPLMEGADYNNQMYFSGPYGLTYINDYEVVFEKNPGFMPGTEYAGHIDKVVAKIIASPDAVISALRSSEILLAESVPNNLVKVVTDDPKLGVVSKLINGIVHFHVNLDPDKITSNIDIRKAILYAIDQDEVITVLDGIGGRGYTAITMLNTGNEIHADPAKVREHLDNYYKSIGK